MIKNYIKTLLKIAVQNKLFTLLSLFGISLTIMFVMIISMTMDSLLNGSGPEKDLKTILLTDDLELSVLKDGKPGDGSTWAGLNATLCRDYISKLKSPNLVAFSTSSEWDFMKDGKRVKLPTQMTDANFWEMFHYAFVEGKPYTAAEVESAGNLAVITESTRNILFGSKEKVVGKLITYKKLQLTICGVVKDPPKTCQHTFGAVYYPYTYPRYNKDVTSPDNYMAAFKFTSKAQAKEIVKEVQETISRLNAELKPKFLRLGGPSTQFQLFLKGFDRMSELSSAWSKLVKYLGWILGFLFLPAVNLMALNYARIHQRNEEIAIRKSFGASSRILIRQLLLENFMMVLVGGLIGILLSYLVIGLFSDYLSIPVTSSIKIPISYSFHVGIFLIAFGGCFLFTIVSGLLPAIRLSKLNPATQLKGGEL